MALIYIYNPSLSGVKHSAPLSNLTEDFMSVQHEPHNLPSYNGSLLLFLFLFFIFWETCNGSLNKVKTQTKSSSYILFSLSLSLSLCGTPKHWNKNHASQKSKKKKQKAIYTNHTIPLLGSTSLPLPILTWKERGKKKEINIHLLCFLPILKHMKQKKQSIKQSTKWCSSFSSSSSSSSMSPSLTLKPL